MWKAVDMGDGYYGQRLVFVPPDSADAEALEVAAEALGMRLTQGRRETITAHLARLANHYTTERSKDEWRMLFEDYCEDLGEFSDAHVIEAIKDHRRTNKWFPKIEELRTRCMELRELDKIRLTRVRRCLGLERP